jgi:hypothetical protein
MRLVRSPAGFDNPPREFSSRYVFRFLFGIAKSRELLQNSRPELFDGKLIETALCPRVFPWDESDAFF